MIKTFYALITLISWGILAFSFIKDRSRYRNCYLLFFALLVTIFSATFLADGHQVETLVVINFFVLIIVLIVPLLLIYNGVVMIRKEGRSLANLLSLGMGILIGAGEIALFVAVLLPLFIEGGLTDPNISTITLLLFVLSLTVVYISLSFLAFMFYTIFLMIIPRKSNFDYVIIHGAGLIDGSKVSKLLADRLDKAIDVYRKDPTPTILIPSGGKGSDEQLSEAEAMARYLIDKGIPEDRIIKEDQSRTTLENLKNSKAIIEKRPGSQYTALVTSNYHVYRALRYCRQIGLECTGIGSRVAFYYWPSALIREFIAINLDPKHLFFLILGWLLFMTPLIPVLI